MLFLVWDIVVQLVNINRRKFDAQLYPEHAKKNGKQLMDDDWTEISKTAKRLHIIADVVEYE